MITIREKVNLIKSGKLKARDNLLYFIQKIDKKNKDLNIFLSFNEESLKQAEELDKRIANGEDVGKLAGICVAVKSNICVEGLETNCASETLKGWIAPYDATVVKKLKDQDAIIIGMVNMDEFACGGSGETSAFGPCKNPTNPQLIPGGSSSGSAAAVAADFCDFAIGSDTGGSIRNPASHCGIFGLKPTYGAVSRYGLVDMCMSFDQIGPLTKNLEDSELVFNILKGQDNFDTTTKEVAERKLDTKKVKVGLVDVSGFATKEIQDLVDKRMKSVIKNNPSWEIKKISLPLDIALETYYLLVYVEFFSATRKFDGRRFGKKIEEVCGKEVLRRIFGGEEVTQAEYEGKYYRNALKARQFIRNEFDRLFKEVDVIILPTVPRTAHKIGENISTKEMYAYDVFTTPSNIAGIPTISVPIGEVDTEKIKLQTNVCRKSAEQDIFSVSPKPKQKTEGFGDKKAVGMQILAPHFCENWIFEVGKRV